MADDFRHRAACRDTDPELFFPVGDSGPAALQVAEAKAVCRTCPVTEACLAWALGAAHEDGVWGGRDAGERAGIRRTRTARAARAAAETRTVRSP